MATAARKIDKTDNLPPPLVTRSALIADAYHLIVEVAELDNECRDLPIVAEDDQDLATITGTATRIIQVNKRLEAARKEQVKPLNDAETVVNDFYKRELMVILAGLKGGLEQIATAYQRKKAQREQAAREAAAAEAKRAAEAAAAKVIETVKANDVPAATQAVTQSNSLAAFAAKASAAAAAPVRTMAKVSSEEGTASLVDNWTFADLDANSIDLETLRPYLPQAAIEQALRAFIKAGHREIKGARIFNDSTTRFRG